MQDNVGSSTIDSHQPHTIVERPLGENCVIRGVYEDRGGQVKAETRPERGQLGKSGLVTFFA